MTPYSRSSTGRTPSIRISPVPAGVIGLAVLFALVEILVRQEIINPHMMPRPSEIILAFGRIVAEEGVVGRFLITGTEAVIASILVAGIGISLGISLWKSSTLSAAIQPWVAAMAAAPIVLAYPLFLVIFGRSQWTIIVVGALSGLPPVILMTLHGLRTVRPTLVNVGKSFHMAPRQIFLKIIFPASLPQIFSGLRIGLIFCLINIVGVEFLINFGGLGPLINELAERYDLPGTYAAIGFVVLISVVVFVALEGAEKWLGPRRQS